MYLLKADPVKLIHVLSKIAFLMLFGFREVARAKIISGIGHGWYKNVGWILFLLLQDARNFAPCLQQTVWRIRQIKCNVPVQGVQPIAWHCSIHVVLDMKVHMPVQKLHKGVQMNCPRAKSEIVNVILQAGMLGIVA